LHSGSGPACQAKLIRWGQGELLVPAIAGCVRGWWG
jgi:hypothetical protein